MNLRYRQRGASMYSMLVIGMLIVYFAVTAFKIAPVYLDDYQVRKVLESVAKEYNDGSVTKSQIKEIISKRFNINNINTIGPKDILIEEDKGQTTLSLDYEVRTPMFYNIDAVLSFSHHIPLNNKSN